MTESKDPRQGWTSASNAAADRRCEGRHQAQKGIVEPPSSDDAKFGSQIHEALKTNNPEGLTTEQLSIYESMLDIQERKIREFFGPEADRVTRIKEERQWCRVLARPGDQSQTPLRYKHSGQFDLLCRIGTRGLIIEYKALPGEVPSSPENEQLRDQVVLASGNLVLNEVGTLVIQPLVTHEPKVCLYNAESIKKAEQEMYVRVRNSNNPTAKRTANAVSCKFCLAKGGCKEYEAWATAIVPNSAQLSNTPVVQWSPEMRAYFLHMRPAVYSWLEVCESEIKRLLKEDPSAVPGWGFKDGRVNRPVNNPQELFNRFLGLSKEKVPADQLLTLFMECVDIKKGELETIVRKLTGLKGKGLSAQMEQLLADITDSKPQAASLTKLTP